MFDPYARTVSRLGRLLAEDGADSLPDAELLRRYAAARDEAAFATLVRRHGPLVFGVCRRALTHEQDAEDAFQATFLVLARRADSVRGNTLGRWLYGVARRVANKARVRRAKRQPLPVDLDFVAAPDRPPLDWLPHLDSALGKLADRDRWPILLCDLQGRTRAEAAAELGIGEGTLSSRLARAREKLRHKLGRLGVSLSASALAAGLAESAAGTVPGALIDNTLAAGSSAAAARDLAEGVMRGMALLTLAKRSTVALGLLAAGVVLVPWAGAEQQPPPKDVPKAEERPAAKSDAERLQGSWVVDTVWSNGPRSHPPRGKHYMHETMTIDGNRVTFARLPGTTKHFRLSPKTSPTWIDFDLDDVPDGLKKVKVRLPCLYEFVGEKLHIVLGGLDTENRPSSLEVMDEGPPFIHLTLHRQSAADRNRDELKGAWRGRPASEETPGTVQLSIGDTELSLQPAFGGGTLLATYSIDPSTNPRQIKLTLTKPWGAWKTDTPLAGIYELEGGRLALAFNQSAPANFRATETNPYTFVFARLDPQGGRTKTDPTPPKPAEKPPAAAKGVTPTPNPNQIRQLQQELARALRTQLEGQFERVKIGKDPLIQLLDARRELWETEMVLAGADSSEKLKACEGYFKDIKVYEEQVAELQNVGLQTQQGVAQAKAARLKAEIELEKLKMEKP